MSGDALSDLLRAVRLRGAVFYYVEGDPPWVAEAPHVREIIPAIMPGTEHMIEFHGVVEGSCWGAIAGEPGLYLEAGDVIMFPHGHPHVMSSDEGLRAPVQSNDLFFSPRPPQLPYTLTVKGADVSYEHFNGRTTQKGSATLACGFLGLDARPFNPLLAALPRVLKIPGSTFGTDSWVARFLGSVVKEARARRPGSEAVLERMTEMLFVDALRRYVDSLPAQQSGWLAGTRDPAVGRALSLIHEKPAQPWTLERLCEEAGLSRSSLHERFTHFIGQPPMAYLTQWRMQVAAGRLRDTNATLVEVALDVGYESEAAFSRAFKRVAGVSPGAWRKGKRLEEKGLEIRV
jgi:AraC-like DNA-binding protein